MFAVAITVVVGVVLTCVVPYSGSTGECPPQTFGPNCTKLCHCPSGDLCNGINGFCSSGECDIEWSGTSCQTRSPMLLSTPRIVSVSLSIIVISWPSWNRSVDIGDPDVTAYRLQQLYADDNNKTWSSVINGTFIPADPLASSMTFEVNYVDPSTVYSFRIVCVWSDYGKPIDGPPGQPTTPFKPTDLYTDPRPPTGISTVNGTDNSVQVTWSMPTPLINAQAYSLVFWTQMSPNDTASMTSSILLLPTVVSYYVNQLMPQTLYYFQLQTQACAFNICRWGNLSDPVPYWTETGRPSSPRHLTWINRNQSCIELQWQRPVYPATKGILVYQIRYSVVVGPAANDYQLTNTNVSSFAIYATTVTVFTAGSEDLVNLTACDLLSATLYSFAVAAANSASRNNGSAFSSLDFGVTAANISVWTELSYRPDSPVVVSVGVSSATFRLNKFQVDPSVATVIEYDVVVIPLTDTESADALPQPLTWLTVTPSSGLSKSSTSSWFVVGQPVFTGLANATSISASLSSSTLYGVSLIATIRMKSDGQQMNLHSWPATMFRTSGVESVTSWSTLTGCPNCWTSLTTSILIDSSTTTSSITSSSASTTLPGNAKTAAAATTGQQLKYASQLVEDDRITDFRWSSLFTNSTVSVTNLTKKEPVSSVTSNGHFVTTTNAILRAAVPNSTSSTNALLSASQSVPPTTEFHTSPSRLFGSVVTKTNAVDMSTVNAYFSRTFLLNYSLNFPDVTITSKSPSTKILQVSESSSSLTAEVSVVSSGATSSYIITSVDAASRTTAAPTASTSSISSSRGIDVTSAIQPVLTTVIVPPLLAPQDLNALFVTSFSASVSWNTPVLPSGFAGRVTDYRVVYWSASGGPNSSLTLSTNGKQANINSLTPFTVYNVQVQARYQLESGLLYGDLSAVFTFTTGDGYPTAPTQLKMTSRSDTCITVQWNQPISLNGLLASYNVTYWPASQSGLTSPSGVISYIQTDASASTSTFQACSLTPSTLYVFVVSASSRAGYGPGAQLNVWTEVTQPAPPPMPSVIAVTQTTIDVLLQPITVSQLVSAVQVDYFVVVNQLGVASGGSSTGRRRRGVAVAVPDPVNYISLPGRTAAQLAGSSESSSSSQTQQLTGTRRFTIGDGDRYGPFVNYALSPQSSYFIYLVVALTLDGTSKMAFAQLLTPVETSPLSPDVSTASSQSSVTGTRSPTPSSYDTTVAAAPVAGSVNIAAIVVPIVVVVVLVAVICAVGVLCWRRRQNLKRRNRELRSLNSKLTAASLPRNGKNNVSTSNDSAWIRYYSNHFYKNDISGSNGGFQPDEVVTTNKLTANDGYRGESTTEDDGGTACQLDSAGPRDIQVSEIRTYQEAVNIAKEFSRLHSAAKVGENYNERCDDTVESRSTTDSKASGTSDAVCFVDGYGGQRRAYVVLSSPIDSKTASNFWEMIDDQKIDTIVAPAAPRQTNAAVSDDINSYRPAEGPGRVYGRLHVQILHCRRLACVDATTFQIRPADVGTDDGSSKTRRVREFRFLDWPSSLTSDGTSGSPNQIPSSSLAFLEFRTKVRRAVDRDRNMNSTNTDVRRAVDSARDRHRKRRERSATSASLSTGKNTQQNDGGPLLVHCPTGRGPSALYVAIDRLLSQAAAENRVSVEWVCSELRRVCPGSIQSVAEYGFVYAALSEALAASFTSTAISDDLKSVYRMMSRLMDSTAPTSAGETGSRTTFDEHFRLLVDKTLPAEGNAASKGVAVSTYRYKDGFVLLNVPDGSRSEGFWRLVHGCRCRSVVTFGFESEIESDDCDVFQSTNAWSPAAHKGAVRCFGTFRVEVVSVEGKGTIRSKTVRVTDTGKQAADFTPLIVRLLTFDGWKKHESTPQRDDFIRLIRAVEDWQQSTGIPSSPVIVQCPDGATQSGLLVVCYIVCEKMIVEGQVSVFHTVKAVKLQKPSVINTLEQYKFCYKVLWEYTKVEKNKKRRATSDEDSLMQSQTSVFDVLRHENVTSSIQPSRQTVTNHNGSTFVTTVHGAQTSYETFTSIA